jgi:hypothetical protein
VPRLYQQAWKVDEVSALKSAKEWTQKYAMKT